MNHVAWRLVPEVRLLILIGALALCAPMPIQAQTIPQVFQQVNPSVVVVRARGRDLVARGGESVRVKYKGPSALRRDAEVTPGIGRTR